MDFQYYPTGAYTTALLWHQFQRPIVHVCDPSAGKGALFRHAENGFEELPEGTEVPWFDPSLEERFDRRRWSYDQRDKYKSSSRKKSAVEIDIKHHASLRELGVTVLGHDFLEVQSLASVTQVIMNPPFNQGAEHVLHAWDLVYDAEISACINAQTIKNPYTRERKRLVELIEKHGRVSFHQDQFVDDVERKTDVEVAIVYLNKVPEAFADVDNILKRLKVGDNLSRHEFDPHICKTLALPANFIENTYYHFSAAIEAARQSSEFEAIFEHASDKLGVTLDEMQSKGVGSDFRPDPIDIRKKAMELFSKRYEDLKRKAWAQIIRSTLLTDKLSNHARRKLEADAETIYALEFSISNVHGFLAGMIQSMGSIYTDMVLGLFDTIIERSSDNVVFYKSWKSNQKHKVGMRIRKKRFIIPRFNTWSSGALQYECEQFLGDIDKVFGYLNGISGDYFGLRQSFRKNNVNTSERFTSEFFEYRYYKGSGTLHFFPKSDEVVDRLNRFVGRIRQWLPQDMGDANEHFKKQYEQAEKYSDDYLKAFSRGKSHSYYERNPVYALTSGRDSENVAERMEKAIDDVLAQAGMECGPILQAPAEVQTVAALPAPAMGQAEQLDLLAA
ncbi:DUF4942 domain-containing protein [Comamonas sp. E6]|uniref:DUF4942 domain-containing protein n=1 Tax=Comamonas sp. E6 TaxID=364029 RepID=UPI000637DCD8|nr:DUF4942 domain-containing protein [Comamonas sp. E6]GAO73472.1 hypothetical protein CSE6_040_49090 [Comamonas sp. E6]